MDFIAVLFEDGLVSVIGSVYEGSQLAFKFDTFT
jgi:hypothetical protein